MRTQYISRKTLLKHIEKIDADKETMDFFTYHSALYVLANYQNCKYYIYDGFSETFKPSKRK